MVSILYEMNLDFGNQTHESCIIGPWSILLWNPSEIILGFLHQKENAFLKVTIQSFGTESNRENFQGRIF